MISALLSIYQGRSVVHTVRLLGCFATTTAVVGYCVGVVKEAAVLHLKRKRLLGAFIFSSLFIAAKKCIDSFESRMNVASSQTNIPFGTISRLQSKEIVNVVPVKEQLD